MKPQILTLGAALALAACAASEPEPLLISTVEVTTDLSAIQGQGAVEYWQTLSSDLETAIAAQFQGSVDPAGHPVTVDVDELSLTETYAAGATIDNAALSGVVTLGDIEPDGREDPAYTVTATTRDVEPYLEDGSSEGMTSTNREYYDALVQAFARGTAETLRAR